MAAPKPPAPQDVPSGSQKQSSVELDPYNLDVQGFGALSTIPVRGAYELFGLSPTTYWGDDQGNVVSSVQKPALTATQAIQGFAHLTGVQLANIQNQMYRAGYYSANYTPVYGQLSAEDIAAFRSMMIGVASNPTAYALPDYLAAAAKAGDEQGINTKTRAPLVVSLRSDNDLRAVIQSGAQSIFGKFLSEDDVQKFISGYHAQQVSAQTASYATSGYNPETGQQDINGAPGQSATVMGPPTSAEGINLQLAQQMYKDHPVTAEMAQFVQHFADLQQTLGQRLPGGGVS